MRISDCGFLVVKKPFLIHFSNSQLRSTWNGHRIKNPKSAFPNPKSDCFRVIHHRLAFSQSYVSLFPIRTASFLAAALLDLAFVLDGANAGDLYVEDLFNSFLDVQLSGGLLDTKSQNLTSLPAVVFRRRILFEDHALL